MQKKLTPFYFSGYHWKTFNFRSNRNKYHWKTFNFTGDRDQLYLIKFPYSKNTQ